MKPLLFAGVGTALVTPFSSQGEICWDELDQLVEYQIAGGVDAIIACGTTGEAATMTAEEHLKTIQFIIERVRGRIPVIAGTGSNDTKFSVELSLEAKALGAQGLLLVTPYSACHLLCSLQKSLYCCCKGSQWRYRFRSQNSGTLRRRSDDLLR